MKDVMRCELAVYEKDIDLYTEQDHIESITVQSQ